MTDVGTVFYIWVAVYAVRFCLLELLGGLI